MKTEIWLGQFSFNKFLLWKDLADRLEDLTRNRIVQHLVEGSGAPYQHVPEDIRPTELDERFHPREIFCPRSADSSQLAAVMAAAAGHDFVWRARRHRKIPDHHQYHAHCLAHGKRVLFVAEKRAALDVVHRRLREEGLEPFCLELHSNKTGKGDVLTQFHQSLDVVNVGQNKEWEERAGELAELRSRLNGYARGLHNPLPCGFSAYSCFDYLLPRQNDPTVRLEGWNDIIETTRAALERARDVSRLLRERALPLGELNSHLLAEIGREEWSPAWSEGMLDRLRAFKSLIEQIETTANDLETCLKVPSTRMSLTQLYNVAYLAETLCSPIAVGPRFATVPWSKLSSEIDNWTTLAQERASIRGQLEASTSLAYWRSV